MISSSNPVWIIIRKLKTLVFLVQDWLFILRTSSQKRLRSLFGNKNEKLGSHETYSMKYWNFTLRSSLRSTSTTYQGELLPGFPSDQLQIDTVGCAGEQALEEAFGFYMASVQRFQRSPRWGNKGKRLVDFGCGWGRIARCFLRDFRAQAIVGVDVDPNLLQICRQTFTGPQFIQCSPLPPLSVDAGSVDFVVGYSVFSHLSEDACIEWIKEFSRILVPDGMVALTTRGRDFFYFCESLKRQSPSGYAEALSCLFPDFSEARRRYDAGEFVHSVARGVSSMDVRTAEYYGETFIPEKYARQVLGMHLQFDEFWENKSESMHPIMFFTKT